MSLVSGASPPARIEVAREPSGSANTKPPALVGARCAHAPVRDRPWLRPPARAPLLGGLLGGLNGGPLDEEKRTLTRSTPTVSPTVLTRTPLIEVRAVEQSVHLRPNLQARSEGVPAQLTTCDHLERAKSNIKSARSLGCPISGLRFHLPKKYRGCGEMGTVRLESTIRGRTVLLSWCCDACRYDVPVSNLERHIGRPVKRAVIGTQRRCKKRGCPRCSSRDTLLDIQDGYFRCLSCGHHWKPDTNRPVTPPADPPKV
jgi:hypothetical protein